MTQLLRRANCCPDTNLLLTCYAPVQSLLFFGPSRLLNSTNCAQSLKDFCAAAVFGRNRLNFCGITGVMREIGSQQTANTTIQSPRTLKLGARLLTGCFSGNS